MMRIITTYPSIGRPFWKESQNRFTGMWRLVICRRIRPGYWQNFWEEARPEQFKTKKEATAFKRRLNAGEIIPAPELEA